MSEDVLETLRADHPRLVDAALLGVGLADPWLEQVAQRATESPIEARFLVAVVRLAMLSGVPSIVCGVPGIEFVWRYNGTVHLAMFCQEPAGPYRCDFLLWDGSDRRLYVECDGHEFHERTKEQARRDRARDRWFTRHGLTLLRFTGSEIHGDPFGCSAEALALLGVR